MKVNMAMSLEIDSEIDIRKSRRRLGNEPGMGMTIMQSSWALNLIAVSGMYAPSMHSRLIDVDRYVSLRSCE